MNSRIVLILVVVVFLSGIFVPVFADNTGGCGVQKIDIIKSIIGYITQKSDINRDQVIVLIKAYLGSLDCGSADLDEARQKADDIDDNVVPKCSDGTLLAHCSANKPKYCYSGKLVNRCDLCCDSGRCGSDGQCEDDVKILDCGQAYGSGFFCGTYRDWIGQCNATGQIKELSYDTCSNAIDGAQYCIKCETHPQIINCEQQYGSDYWCSTYDEWNIECQGRGHAVDLANAKCYESGGIFKGYCSTCMSDEPDCHTHVNPSWIDSGAYKIKVIDIGCTQIGCAEGDHNGTEVLIELREGVHCGEQVWVWLDTMMSPNMPDVGACYMAEIFTEMYGSDCGHVIRYLMSTVDCPDCNSTCPNGVCSAGENCSADASACTDRICYEPTCLDGCSEVAVGLGSTDESCNSLTGCSNPPCSCDGYGNCVSESVPECHSHANPSWIDNGAYKIKIIDIGCSQSGCAEGNGNGIEVLIELREGAYCGEQVWVWLDTMMSPNMPDIGACYMAEIFTEMYGSECGHVIRYIFNSIDCPDC